MDDERFQRLVLIMERLAGGDEAAVFTLYGEFGGQVAAAVRRHLRRMGVAGLPLDDVDAIVMDVVFSLADCAGGWQPAAGALPWVWADRRVGAIVAAAIGQHADELRPELLADVVAVDHLVGGDEPDELEVLARLATDDVSCHLLLEALEEVTTRRNGALLLGYKLQASLGDWSPATTIGGQYGMKPASVRQTVKRTLDRLRSLADADPRFSALRDMALLA